MAADDIAVARSRHRADDRPAIARTGGTPVNREPRFAAGLGMRGEANMIGSVQTGHCKGRKGDGPPTTTGQTVKFTAIPAKVRSPGPFLTRRI